MTTLLKCPSVRFVERGGRTVVDELSKSNPWAKEAACCRKGCLPCWGRGWLETEKAEASEARREGREPAYKIRKELTTSLPNCRKEGINYTLECITYEFFCV